MEEPPSAKLLEKAQNRVVKSRAHSRELKKRTTKSVVPKGKMLITHNQIALNQYEMPGYFTRNQPEEIHLNQSASEQILQEVKVRPMTQASCFSHNESVFAVSKRASICKSST